MSKTVSFREAVQTLQSMFSHVHRERIKDILNRHNGVMERAVDTLLHLPVNDASAAAPSSRARAYNGRNLPSTLNMASIDTTIRSLEMLKRSAIQNESFLEAEDLKNRIAALRREKSQRLRHHHSETPVFGHRIPSVPTNNKFDELTPLFLRKINRRSKNFVLPETFLRSPDFRKSIVENKILASGLAMQLNNEFLQVPNSYTTVNILLNALDIHTSILPPSLPASNDWMAVAQEVAEVVVVVVHYQQTSFIEFLTAANQPTNPCMAAGNLARCYRGKNKQRRIQPCVCPCILHSV